MTAPSPLEPLGSLNGRHDRRVAVGALVHVIEPALFQRQHLSFRLAGGGTYDAALRNHGLQALGREHLLRQRHEVDLERVEEHVARHEDLVGLAEAEELERAHELLVLLGALAHGGGGDLGA